MFDEQQADSPEASQQDLARRILVVVPVLNEAPHIEACLRQLYVRDVQFVVADGGSTDGTQDIVRQIAGDLPGVSLIENPDRVQAAGVNVGARAGDAARDILVRCDAHAGYPAGYVVNVAKALEKTGAESLVVPMDAVGTSCFQKANAWVVDTPLGSGGSAHRGGHKSGYIDHGHHAAFRRDRFLSLGGYDESFSHNEDAEYDARLRQAGGKIFLDASIRIGYYPRTDIKSLWRQYFGYGKGRARNLLKNDEKPHLRQLAPVANILVLTACLVLSLVHAAWLAGPMLYLGTLGCVSLWFALTKRSACGLWAGTALGAMHLAWGLGFLKGAIVVMRGRAA